jgi:hypothetical protein
MGFHRSQGQVGGRADLSMTHSFTMGQHHTKPLNRPQTTQGIFKIHPNGGILIVSRGYRHRLDGVFIADPLAADMLEKDIDGNSPQPSTKGPWRP